jgi:transposase-like protein
MAMATPRSQSQSTRRRWKESEARSLLESARASGLTLSAFAAREGLAAHRLYFWRRRLEREAGKDSNPPVAFVELRKSATAAVEVVLRSGRVLRVSESIDAGALRRLVDVLEQERAC